MSWILDENGDATCMKDYVSMNTSVVELFSQEDLALALQYLNPSLSPAETKSWYSRGKPCPTVEFVMRTPSPSVAIARRT